MDGRAREGELLLVYYSKGAACAFSSGVLHKILPQRPRKKRIAVSSITCADPAPSHHIVRCSLEKFT